jgi:hypothetical protein
MYIRYLHSSYLVHPEGREEKRREEKRREEERREEKRREEKRREEKRGLTCRKCKVCCTYSEGRLLLLHYGPYTAFMIMAKRLTPSLLPLVPSHYQYTHYQYHHISITVAFVRHWIPNNKNMYVFH